MRRRADLEKRHVIPLLLSIHARNSSRAGSRGRTRERERESLPISLSSTLLAESLRILRPQHNSAAQSYNRLQLPSVAQRVLNHRAAGAHDVPVRRLRLGLLLGEVDAAVLGQPAARLRKLHHGALGVEEQQVLGVGDGEGGVGALGARGDFGADGVDEDLFLSISLA